MNVKGGGFLTFEEIKKNKEINDNAKIQFSQVISKLNKVRSSNYHIDSKKGTR